jgi:hypothetical protein
MQQAFADRGISSIRRPAPERWHAAEAIKDMMRHLTFACISIPSCAAGAVGSMRAAVSQAVGEGKQCRRCGAKQEHNPGRHGSLRCWCRGAAAVVGAAAAAAAGAAVAAAAVGEQQQEDELLPQRAQGPTRSHTQLLMISASVPPGVGASSAALPMPLPTSSIMQYYWTARKGQHHGFPLPPEREN